MQVTAESKFIGLGVAGNFAGHLEQAGEASDFVAVVVRVLRVEPACRDPVQLAQLSRFLARVTRPLAFAIERGQSVGHRSLPFSWSCTAALQRMVHEHS